jgi:hypothetical protein
LLSTNTFGLVDFSAHSLHLWKCWYCSRQSIFGTGRPRELVGTHIHTHTCPTLGCCIIVVLIFHVFLDTTVIGFNKFSSLSASVLS